ncbi:hypothetical protein CFOL_v3_10031 [Cephalotus follicularis]|uniref:Uncharacterized protein n=1 Tax=Cephalotus follicularis TaxID=3775 RepID=A0A1Q3BEU5_CEPFO|nr:hypothetical protein CFOL_v3_10031 [Cephalotus follicularis]
MGLNESYGGIKSQILMMIPLPTVGQAYSLISQEESHRGIIAGTNSQSDMSAVFYSNTNNFKIKDDNRCEHCKWTGCENENCYGLIGYPLGHKLYKGKKGGGFNSGNQKFTKSIEVPKKPMVNSNVSKSSTELILSNFLPK